MSKSHKLLSCCFFVIIAICHSLYTLDRAALSRGKKLIETLPTTIDIGGILIIDGDNLRGKTSFAVSKENLMLDLEQLRTSSGLQRIILHYDHGSENEAYLIKPDYCVVFSGTDKSDDIIARDIKWMHNFCDLNITIVTSDSGLKSRCHNQSGKRGLNVIDSIIFAEMLAFITNNSTSVEVQISPDVIPGVTVNEKATQFKGKMKSVSRILKSKSRNRQKKQNKFQSALAGVEKSLRSLVQGAVSSNPSDLTMLTSTSSEENENIAKVMATLRSGGSQSWKEETWERCILAEILRKNLLADHAASLNCEMRTKIDGSSSPLLVEYVRQLNTNFSKTDFAANRATLPIPTQNDDLATRAPKSVDTQQTTLVGYPEHSLNSEELPRLPLIIPQALSLGTTQDGVRYTHSATGCREYHLPMLHIEDDAAFTAEIRGRRVSKRIEKNSRGALAASANSSSSSVEKRQLQFDGCAVSVYKADLEDGIEDVQDRKKNALLDKDDSIADAVVAAASSEAAEPRPNECNEDGSHGRSQDRPQPQNALNPLEAPTASAGADPPPPEAAAAADPAAAAAADLDYRIVCISDTHGMEHTLSGRVPPGDLLIHAGDFIGNGVDRASMPLKVRALDAWLASLPHPVKIVVRGNHDPPEAAFPLSKALYASKATVVRLTKQKRGNGLRVALAPSGTEHPPAGDILISHEPPYGVGSLDEANKRKLRVGSLPLLRAANRFPCKPAVWVCGHIHEGYGAVEHEFERLFSSDNRKQRGKPSAAAAQTVTTPSQDTEGSPGGDTEGSPGGISTSPFSPPPNSESRRKKTLIVNAANANKGAAHSLVNLPSVIIVEKLFPRPQTLQEQH